MDQNRLTPERLANLNTPCYLVDEQALRDNLKVFKDIQERSGCKILMALKAFAMPATFPLIREYLPGICASSPYEARLGREAFRGEVHTYAPAYSESDILELNELTDYLVFNSIDQLNRFKTLVSPKIKLGLRINPGYSEIEIDLYNPCAPGSRLGIPFESFSEDLSGISGLHFHAMCEQNADTLERILKVVEEKFGPSIQQLEWINFGGGHHITRPDYNIDLLVELITRFKKKYNVEILLEPGEAVSLNCGVLVASVLDIIHNERQIAILDTSAENHMPDVLAMPYRPEIWGAGPADQTKHTYRLTGVTCLAGDIIGDYSFSRPLTVGDKLVFDDMAHYSMVKNTVFNGVRLPSIALMDCDGNIQVTRKPSYQDYFSRV